MSPGARRAPVGITLGELRTIETLLDRGEKRGENPRACYEAVAKLRRSHAAGPISPEVRRKLEQLLGRFSNARFGR